MSLINDMLRDLDTRNAASNERSGLTHNIRALPPQAERRMHPLLLILLAATAGGAVVWLLQKTAAGPAPEAAPVAAAPAAALTPDAPPLPEIALAPLAEEAPLPAAASGTCASCTLAVRVLAAMSAAMVSRVTRPRLTPALRAPSTLTSNQLSMERETNW